jgi:two-component system, NarL family, invasion response regulator UvrY
MLVDDHAVVRTGFKLLLHASSDIKVIAEADSGEAACQMYESAAPDVVVMDIAMAGMGGIESP